MRCEVCGAEYPVGVQVCENCGEPVFEAVGAQTTLLTGGARTRNFISELAPGEVLKALMRPLPVRGHAELSIAAWAERAPWMPARADRGVSVREVRLEVATGGVRPASDGLHYDTEVSVDDLIGESSGGDERLPEVDIALVTEATQAVSSEESVDWSGRIAGLAPDETRTEIRAARSSANRDHVANLIAALGQ